MRLKGIKKIKRMKFLSTILIFFLVITLNVAFICASERETTLKEDLMILGIIKDGTGVYDTNIVNKQEMVTVLVRMLGKEEYALNEDVSIPFTDVAKWNEKYVNYVYNEDILKGTSDTTFGGKEYFGINHAVTFMLRTLGYEDEKDFEWNKAYDYALEIGLLSEEDNLDKETFTRSDMFTLIEKTLKFDINDKNKTSSSSSSDKKTLIRKLVDDKAYTEEKCNETVRFRFEEKKDNIVTKIIKKITHSGGSSSGTEKTLEEIYVTIKTPTYIGIKLTKEDLLVEAKYSDGTYKTISNYTANFNEIDEMRDNAIQLLKISYTEGDVTKTKDIPFTYEYFKFGISRYGYLEWIVLNIDKTKNKMLVVSKDASNWSYYLYDDPGSSSTWENSTLRMRLNDSERGFIAENFTPKEQKLILDTELSDVNTTDKIFALSKEEVDEYLESDNRKVTNVYREPVSYWLRTPGDVTKADIVTEEGTCDKLDVTEEIYVRQAINIKYEEKELIAIRAYTSDYIFKNQSVGINNLAVCGIYDDYSIKTLFDYETNIDDVDLSTTGLKTLEVTYFEGRKKFTDTCNFTVVDIGDEIELGKYYQENDYEKTPVTWIVIGHDSDPFNESIKVISKNILRGDYYEYDDEPVQTKFVDSAVYWRLNDDPFYYDVEFDDRKIAFEYVSGHMIYYSLPDLSDIEVLKAIGKEKGIATPYALDDNDNVQVAKSGEYSKYWLRQDTESFDIGIVDETGNVATAQSNSYGIGTRVTMKLSEVPIPEFLNSIEIITEKQYGIVGKPITENDFEVVALYSDGTGVTLTDYDSNLSSLDFSTRGTKTLNVSYEEDGFTYTDSVSFEYYEIGDTFTFGNYWQSNSTEKEPIEWIILGKKDPDPNDQGYWLLSKKLLDCVPYDDGDAEYWFDATLNSWLKWDNTNSFAGDAFTSSESNHIYRCGYNDIFCKEWIESCLTTAESRKAEVTNYAKTKASYDGTYGGYYLRPLDEWDKPLTLDVVKENGTIEEDYRENPDEKIFVRPIILYDFSGREYIAS